MMNEVGSGWADNPWLVVEPLECSRVSGEGEMGRTERRRVATTMAMNQGKGKAG